MQNKIRIIGLTGPIGSGKSYVGRLFKKAGYNTIDSDKVYHKLTSGATPLTKALKEQFGSRVINNDGSLNRAELSSIVFADDSKLNLLNQITHTAVINSILQKCSVLSSKGIDTVIVEVPLMFESGFDKHCYKVVSVIADEQTRIKRIMKRNAFSEVEAIKRIKKQKNNNFYIENSDLIVYNNTYAGARADFKRVLADIFKK